MEESVSDSYAKEKKEAMDFVRFFRLGIVVLLAQNLILPPGIIVLSFVSVELLTFQYGLLPLTLDILGFGFIFLAMRKWKSLFTLEPLEEKRIRFGGLRLMELGSISFVLTSLLWRIPYFFFFSTEKVFDCLTPSLFEGEPEYCDALLPYTLFIFMMVFFSNFGGLFVFWVGVLRALEKQIITKLLIVIYVLSNAGVLLLTLVDILNGSRPYSLVIKTLTSVFILIPLIQLAISGPFGFKLIDYYSHNISYSEYDL